MLETIADGDIMLIDSSVTEVAEEGIYLVVLEGAVMVKRLQIVLGGLRVISDNPRYQAQFIRTPDLADVQVRGRFKLIIRRM